MTISKNSTLTNAWLLVLFTNYAFAIEPPDTTSWLQYEIKKNSSTLLMKYERDNCLIMTSKDNDRLSMDAGGNGHPLERIFIAHANSPQDFRDKLAVLAERGVLANSTHPDVPAGSTAYVMTYLGWQNILFRVTEGRGLCFTFGTMEPLQVVSYRLLNDQGSGLDVFEVTVEVGLQYADWVNDKIKTMFPQNHRTYEKTFIVIDGPSGFYHPETIVMPETHPVLSASMVEEEIRNNLDLLTTLCNKFEFSWPDCVMILKEKIRVKDISFETGRGNLSFDWHVQHGDRVEIGYGMLKREKNAAYTPMDLYLFHRGKTGS